MSLTDDRIIRLISREEKNDILTFVFEVMAPAVAAVKVFGVRQGRHGVISGARNIFAYSRADTLTAIGCFALPLKYGNSNADCDLRMKAGAPQRIDGLREYEIVLTFQDP